MTLAAVFPGQGSQSLGMLDALAERHASVAETFREASDVLGFDLWKLVSEGPKERLDQTRQTQPAMLAAGVAVWRVWRERGGPEPCVAAGHSLGEYSALVAAGALEFSSAMALVADRARLMQEAVAAGAGGIAAVLGLDDEAVIAICSEVSARMAPRLAAAVNFNSPGQVVVAGHRDAVEEALRAARDAGARKAVPLPMSVPVHCELMRPAAEALSASLERTAFDAPRFPVIHNADLLAHADAESIRAALSAQLYTPVRWSETVRKLIASGVDRVVECGPGRVLTGLTRRIDRALDCVAVHDPETLDAAIGVVGGAR